MQIATCAELNRLYLSTIETLAMAIDAKDQITHGHIRRVQVQAVDFANAMGVTEDASDYARLRPPLFSMTWESWRFRNTY